MKDVNDILVEVKQVAQDAGNFIREQRMSFDPSCVEMKGTHDYVSYVDKSAEMLIVERLKSIVPEAGFITEEGTVRNAYICWNENRPSIINDYSSKLIWVVDPLDGTTNFVHDMAPYCVAIALRNEDEILVGVVYEIAGDELFYTCKGQPSYLNGREIHVGNAKAVDDAFINIGYPYDVKYWKPRMLRLVDMLYGNCASIRNLGSAEAELCYVACGRFDVYIESHLKPWDVTAGGLVLKNAGGRVSDYSGTERWLTGEQLLATNGLVHDELLNKIQNIIN